MVIISQMQFQVGNVVCGGEYGGDCRGGGGCGYDRDRRDNTYWKQLLKQIILLYIFV